MFFKNLHAQPLTVGERHPAPDAVIEIDSVTTEIQNYIDRGLGALVDPTPAAEPDPPKTDPPQLDPPPNADNDAGDKNKGGRNK